MDALASLKDHFAAMAPREVVLPGMSEPVFINPLNAEEAFAFSAALRQPNAREQALGIAGLAVRKTRDADGKRVFTGANAVKDLATKCAPEVITKIMEVFSEDGAPAEAEDVEKKSDSTAAEA